MCYLYWLGKFVHSFCYPCIDVSIVCFFCEIIYFLQILMVSLKSGSCCINYCPYGCLGRNTLRPCTCILIWRLRLRCLYGFYGGQVWCWCADLSWIIYHMTSCSESCSMGLFFWWSDIAYRYHICCLSLLWFVFMEYKLDCISPSMCLPTLV